MAGQLIRSPYYESPPGDSQLNILSEEVQSANIHESIARENGQVPAFSHIPGSLYLKAAKHHEDLTEDERRLLNSRGDLVGKALSYPDTLSEAEIHELLLWRPPEIVRKTFQEATDGKVSTPSEFYAIGKAALDRGEDLQATFGDAALRLPGHHFHAPDDTGYNPGTIFCASRQPGWDASFQLLNKRQGVDAKVMITCFQHGRKQDAVNNGQENAWLEEQAKVQRAIDAVPKPILEITTRMQSLHNQLDFGYISKQQVIAQSWIELEALRAVAGPERIQYKPANRLLRSMHALQMVHMRGDESDDDVVGGLQLHLSSFTRSLFGHNSSSEDLVSYEDSHIWNSWPLQMLLDDPPTAFQLFTKRGRRRDGGRDSGQSEAAWAELTEWQKQIYRDEHEELRLAAWKKHKEQRNALSSSPASSSAAPVHTAPATSIEYKPPRKKRPGEPQRRYEDLANERRARKGLPPLEPPELSGLHVFHGEVAFDMEFDLELMRRWDKLSQEERDAWDAKAAAIREAEAIEKQKKA